MNVYDEIKNVLRSFEANYLRKQAIYGLLTTLFLFAIVLTGLSLLEIIFFFGITLRTIFFILLVAVSAGVTTEFIFPFLKSFYIFHKPDYKKYAGIAGNLIPTIKDRLINIIEIEDEKSSLTEAAAELVLEELKKNNDKLNLSYKYFHKRIYLFPLLTVLLILLTLTTPINKGLYRILNFQKDFSYLIEDIIEVTPGDISVIRGDSLRISAKVTNHKVSTITFMKKKSSDIDFQEYVLNPDKDGNFIFDEKNIYQEFSFYFATENSESKIYKVSIIERPIIKRIEAVLNYPRYTGLKQVTQIDDANITALRGTKVNFKIKSSKPLQSGFMKFKSKKIPMNIEGYNASVSINLYNNDNFFFEIIDTSGIINKNPVNYKINILEDDYPSIEVISPNKNIDLDKSGKVNIAASINDDYGFSKMKLVYKIISGDNINADTSFQTIPLKINKNLNTDLILYFWDLSSKVLFPDDVIRYYFELWDNDYVKGPKKSVSKNYEIRIPSIDELFNQVNNENSALENDLRETFTEAKKIDEKFDKISQELKKKNRKLDLNEKNKVENLVKNFEKLTKKVDDIKSKFNEVENKLKKNNLLSEETMKKYSELKKIMEEMKNSDLLKSLKNMKEMLSKLDRKKVQTSLSDLKKNESIFKDAIEKTLNLLKKLKVEMKTDEIKNKISEIKKNTEELKKKVENSNLNDENTKKNLAKAQSKETDKINKLKKDLEELEKNMADLKNMPVDSLKNIKENFNKNKPAQTSRNAESKIKQGEKKAAENLQQQLLSQLSKMQKQISNMQNSMRRNDAMKSISELVKMMNNLLEISNEQEKLSNSIGEENRQSLSEKSKKQNEILDKLKKTISQASSFSKESFSISPEMGKALGNAKVNMEKALQDMQEGRSFGLKNNMSGAMASINDAAKMIESSMGQMMQGGGSGQGGMMSLMQQLQQLAEQQMSLNQLTQMLKQEGGLSQKQIESMKRLANRQEAIRKKLEELNKESKYQGNKKKLAANLDKTLDEIKEVISQLRGGSIDNNLLKKQSRILSRLLDAQRSINERDFEKRRESISAENILGKDPGEIDLNNFQDRNILKEALKKALERGYQKDYEKLIKEYFNRLEAEKVLKK